MGVSVTSATSLEVAEKQLKALQLRKAGRSFDEIKVMLGYSHASGAHQAVMQALNRMLKEPAEELRTLELERLDVLHKAAWPKAVTGDVKAIQSVLRIMERRATLLGLDRPTKVQIDLVHADAIRLGRLYGISPDEIIAIAKEITVQNDVDADQELMLAQALDAGAAYAMAGSPSPVEGSINGD